MKKIIPINQVVRSVSITHKFNKDELIFLNTSDVENGKIINKKYSKTSELKGQAKKTIKKDDILFSEIRPKNRRFAYVDFEDTDDYVVSTKLMVLRKINEDVNNKYFYYFLTNDNMLSVLQSRAENRICSFPQITFDLLSEYGISVPNLLDQQKIVSVLSNIDSKIELNNKINVELESMAKILYDYWFVQFDFPDENGKPYKCSGGKMVWNEEIKREIPEGWEVKKLKEIFKFEKGIEPGSSEYLDSSVNGDCIKFFRVKDIEGESAVYVDSSNKKYVIAGERDVIVTFDGSVGKLGFGLCGAISGGLRKVYDKSKKFDNSLVYFVFKDQRIIATIHKYATGSILLHASSSIDHLKIPFEENMYLKFQDIAKPIFDQMVKNKKENQKLAKLRDWLLPMLMNGQVKVKE